MAPKKLDQRSCRRNHIAQEAASSSKGHQVTRSASPWSLQTALDPKVLSYISEKMQLSSAKGDELFPSQFQALKEVMTAATFAENDDKAHHAFASLDPASRKVAAVCLRSRLTGGYVAWMTSTKPASQARPNIDVFLRQGIRKDTLERHFHSVLKKALVDDMNSSTHNTKGVRNVAREGMRSFFEKQERQSAEVDRLMDRFLYSACTVSEGWICEHLYDTGEVDGQPKYWPREKLVAWFEKILSCQEAIWRQACHCTLGNVCSLLEKVRCWMAEAAGPGRTASWESLAEQLAQSFGLYQNPASTNTSKSTHPWKIQAPWPLPLVERTRKATLTSLAQAKALFTNVS